MPDRRARVSDLVDSRPLSARSVLASALLGADEPRLSAGALVMIASLFGISDGAARTCLWRMVSGGELTSDDGSYALAGRLLERRERVDDASRMVDGTAIRAWDGTWELAVVSLERRSATDRLELRKAATALHMAELREGVWVRPDNLDPHRFPGLRAVLGRQCVRFHHATAGITGETVRVLFGVDNWAADARRLIEAMDAELGTEPADGFPYQFALSIAVVRHLQLDPQLPAELTPQDWPGTGLRRTYRRFDDAFKRRLNNSFRRTAR